MSAVAFDPLEYAQQLEAAGMPRAQAEVVAKGLTSMFIHNFDTLVTKDYLDVRLSEFETRLLSIVDKRLTELDKRVDLRFHSVENRFNMIEERFEERFNDVDKRFNAVDIRFAEMDGKLGQQQLMLGVIMAGLSIPIIQTLVIWLA
jgi:regulator of PEP synthase PpsR (kinase-PPPase family)